MSFRLRGGLAGLACGAALAQPPAVPTPATPSAPVKPATHSEPWTVDITPGSKSADASATFPKALSDARSALAAARDYTATLVRQERVNGVLRPDETCELQVRLRPAAVRLAVIAPKPGSVTTFVPARSTILVKHQVGTGAVKSLGKDDAAARSGRHPITGYGVAAMLDRLDAVLADQQRQHRPTQVLSADYSFAGKPVTRFEVFADRPTADAPRRIVLCMDAATKLPVRYEAYGPATPAAAGGEVLEVVSLLNLKLNAGLGDAVFER